jgi:PAS domain S-box-containing protein
MVFAACLILTLAVSLYIEVLSRGKRIASEDAARKKTELEVSEERYKTIVDSQSEIIVRFLPDGTLTFVNEACAKFFGSTKERLLGGKLMPLIVAEDIPRVMAALESLSSLNGNGCVEVRAYGGKGDIRWVQFNYRAFFDTTGVLLDIQGVGQDITDMKLAEDALRESERRYKAVVDNTADLIMMTRPDGVITFLSPACEKITGYSPEALIGKSFFSIVADDPEKVRNKYSGSLKAGERVDIEFSILTGEGRTKWVCQSVSSVSEGGKPVFSASVVRDITAKKCQEDATAERMRDMEKFTKYTIGREKDIIRLKEEVNALLEKAGEPKRYLKGS